MTFAELAEKRYSVRSFTESEPNPRHKEFRSTEDLIFYNKF